jgi:hypothetical protein
MLNAKLGQVLLHLQLKRKMKICTIKVQKVIYISLAILSKIYHFEFKQDL